jgi:D-3-phosphoglycerate dehydrogenase / 2-oxoglutarate reductase
MPNPRVLISDKLSPAAAKIFADRGIEADVTGPASTADELMADHRRL